MTIQPSLFIPHGGGPCFFMPDPRGTWTKMGDYLRALPATLPEPPRAILVVSGHWEERAFAFTGASGHPGLIFDYYGFPPETYQLTWPAPGAPWLAERGAELLRAAGLPTAIDPERGFDHGVFVPLKVMFPAAEVPVVQMSLHASLDPALHLAAGEALAPLRDDGVLVLDDSEVVLGPGEVVVQRGTDHAWENRSDEVTRMAFFHIAAEFSDELLGKLPQPLALME